MPEDQKPFVHQDRTTNPPGHSQPEQAFDRSAIANLIEALSDDLRIIESLPTVALASEVRHRARGIQLLQQLQDPAIRTTASALTRLPADTQLLVSDVATALAAKRPDQQNLANELRKLIEGRS